MAKVDIHKSSDEEIADSQLDYYIKAGIFKEPGEVDKSTMEENKRIKEKLPTPYITNEHWYGPLSPPTKFYINRY